MNAWKKTAHYNGIAKRVGFRDQVMLAAEHGRRFVVQSFFRDQAFSDKETCLLGFLQQHLRANWRRLEHYEAARNTRRLTKLTLTASLRPDALSRETHALLRAYFPAWNTTDTLPDELWRWACECLQTYAHYRGKLAPRFQAASSRGTINIAFHPPLCEQPAYLMLIENYHQDRNLTARERQILRLVGQGLRDAEIAQQLACSVRTVGKHIEHILLKLQTENRSAAVNMARLFELIS